MPRPDKINALLGHLRHGEIRRQVAVGHHLLGLAAPARWQIFHCRRSLVFIIPVLRDTHLGGPTELRIGRALDMVAGCISPLAALPDPRLGAGYARLRLVILLVFHLGIAQFLNLFQSPFQLLDWPTSSPRTRFSPSLW
jgi:hypothetical protein